MYWHDLDSITKAIMLPSDGKDMGVGGECPPPPSPPPPSPPSPPLTMTLCRYRRPSSDR